jgi:subtilisin family serine protease
LHAAIEGSSSGRGVLVGIFDTSPFPPTLSHVVLENQTPLALDLRHPIIGGYHGAACEAADVRDHGLYAAGLVHAVAPASEIRLIRVLDDTGQGDLQTLNRALLAFISEVVERKGTDAAAQQQAEPDGTLRGAVINLSLGVHPPPDAAEQGLPEEIASLGAILSVAQCFDLVTVAAAGNDSALSDAPLPPQIPAAWPSAIGVAASNANGQLSCFSNEGQIMAPGGDGGPHPSACRSMLQTCEDDCPYALISLSLLSPTGYIYWHGTSFSTPLVSGWAAALVDRAGGWLPQERVLTEMMDSGRPSAGPDPDVMIIDVSDTSP